MGCSTNRTFSEKINSSFLGIQDTSLEATIILNINIALQIIYRRFVLGLAIPFELISLIYGSNTKKIHLELRRKVFLQCRKPLFVHLRH